MSSKPPIKQCDYCETTGVMPTFMDGETMCDSCFKASRLSTGQILGMLKERDQLKAQVNDLRASITKEAALVLRERFGIDDEDIEERLRQSACRLIDTRKKSFTQSLAEHDAALLERVAEKLCDQQEFNGTCADICFSDDLFDEASRIRHQTKENDYE